MSLVEDTPAGEELTTFESLTFSERQRMVSVIVSKAGYSTLQIFDGETRHYQHRYASPEELAKDVIKWVEEALYDSRRNQLITGEVSSPTLDDNYQVYTFSDLANPNVKTWNGVGEAVRKALEDRKKLNIKMAVDVSPEIVRELEVTVSKGEEGLILTMTRNTGTVEGRIVFSKRGSVNLTWVHRLGGTLRLPDPQYLFLNLFAWDANERERNKIRETIERMYEDILYLYDHRYGDVVHV